MTVSQEEVAYRLFVLNNLSDLHLALLCLERSVSAEEKPEFKEAMTNVAESLGRELEQLRNALKKTGGPEI